MVRMNVFQQGALAPQQTRPYHRLTRDLSLFLNTNEIYLLFSLFIFALAYTQGLSNLHSLLTDCARL